MLNLLDEGLAAAAANKRDFVKIMSGVVSGPPALVRELTLFFLFKYLLLLLLLEVVVFFLRGADGTTFVDRVAGI